MEQFAVILIKHGIDFSFSDNGKDVYQQLRARYAHLEIDSYPDSLFINLAGEVKKYMTQPEDIKEATEYLESICEQLNK